MNKNYTAAYNKTFRKKREEGEKRKATIEAIYM
jgi:hypothetical protein